VESENERELFSELRKIRKIAKQKVKKAQHSQKTQTNVLDLKITEGDLVMLKVDPKFKLDRSFHGPF